MIRTDLIAPLGVLLRRHASERGAKIAFEDARTAVTYAELEARTARLAGYLQAGGPGRRIAILLPNSVDWVVACIAIVRAGCVAVPISHDATEPEIRYRLEDAACSALVVSAHHLPLAQRLRDASPSLETLIATSEDVPSNVLTLAALLACDSGNPPHDPADIDATAFVVYTSGTTGKAKGVMLTLRAMLWVTATCWVLVTDLGEDDVVLSPLPLFHSYALNLSVLSVLAVGATEHLLERFSTVDVLAKLRTGRFTLMPGVPTMFHYLLEGARDAAADDGAFPGVRRFVSAGAILPSALNRAFEERFRVELLDGYGITETATMVTMNWPGDGRAMGSCGLPLTGLAVRLVDADGRDVPVTHEGELIVRGPNLMQGYLDKPAETAAALRDGWYRTGDLARSDHNGFLTITGRLKELIIRGGQNIAPAEVEEAVLAHPDVLDCAAVGIAHEHLGEVPVAFVMPRPGSVCDPATLIRHCQTLLSAYKVPHAVHVVDAIPRTGSGKIMRFKLREWLAAQPG